jgi:predicted ester cyclase
MSEDNKALVREMLAGADDADITILDKFLGEKYDDHNPPPFQQGTGPEAIRDAFKYALNAFSDFHHEVAAQYVDGDTVITRIIGSGKHTGEFLGVPATGQQVSMEGIAIHRVENGKLVEHWSTVDALSLMMQIGAIPAPG